MNPLRRTLSILMSLNLLVACAPDSREAVSEVQTTYVPQQPDVIDEGGYKVVRGATRVQDMTVQFDSATKGMKFKGKIEFLPVRGSAVQAVDLDLGGILDANGFIALKAAKSKAETKEALKVAAKATCLSAEGDCRSSFIDIYIYHQDIVYHHQVESIQDDAKTDEATESPEDQQKDEELEIEGGADAVEGEPGRYVGDVADDIEKILEIKKPEVKKEEPKAEEPPAETPKAEVPKVEEPKSPPKKEDPPKREEPKKNPPKTEQPRQQPTSVPTNFVSQAIGPVNNGRLQKAANMLAYEQKHEPAGFHIIRPQRKTHFATNELAYVILKMAQLTKTEIPGYEVAVGDLSREAGGRLGSHKSHQNGLDADVAYYFNNKSFQGYFASAVAVDKPHANWMMEVQWKLFKEVVSTQLIDRIFIHNTLKKALCTHAIQKGELVKGDTQSLAAQTLRRLISEPAHNNHFHLRVKCSKAQVRCRQMAEPVNTTGCF